MLANLLVLCLTAVSTQASARLLSAGVRCTLKSDHSRAMTEDQCLTRAAISVKIIEYTTSTSMCRVFRESGCELAANQEKAVGTNLYSKLQEGVCWRDAFFQTYPVSAGAGRAPSACPANTRLRNGLCEFTRVSDWCPTGSFYYEGLCYGTKTCPTGSWWRSSTLNVCKMHGSVSGVDYSHSGAQQLLKNLQDQKCPAGTTLLQTCEDYDKDSFRKSLVCQAPFFSRVMPQAPTCETGSIRAGDGLCYAACPVVNGKQVCWSACPLGWAKCGDAMCVKETTGCTSVRTELSRARVSAVGASSASEPAQRLETSDSTNIPGCGGFPAVNLPTSTAPVRRRRAVDATPLYARLAELLGMDE